MVKWLRNRKRWVEERTLEWSAFLTALLLGSLPASAGDFDFNSASSEVKGMVDTGYSLVKDIATKVIAIIFLIAEIAIVGVVISHIISSYNRKREMGQGSPWLLAGYVLGAIAVIVVAMILFVVVYKGLKTLMGKF